MKTYTLKTHDNPLARVRQFLTNVWDNVMLDGMVIPTYQGLKSVKQTVIYQPDDLQTADPFAPLMQVNASKVVVMLAHEMPNDHMAAVLRACEIRALHEQVKRGNVNLENWLIIGVDCPACFPAQDFEWRVDKAGSVEALTRDVLRNTRQGVIALDRFRSACQICAKPESPNVDICIDLLGLPVKETMLVSAKNSALIEELRLEKITDGPATNELIEQRDRMLKMIEERRERIRQRQLHDLAADMPANLDQLMDFLANCQPCVKCMEACPVHAEELVPAVKNHLISKDMTKRWLVSCAECGMCEQACPKEIPLAAIMNRIGRELKSESLAF